MKKVCVEFWDEYSNRVVEVFIEVPDSTSCVGRK